MNIAKSLYPTVLLAVLLTACAAEPTQSTPSTQPTQAPAAQATEMPATEAPQVPTTEATEAAMPASTMSTFKPVWQAVSCDELDVSTKLSAEVECGYFTVPENRAKGSDKTIQLGVVRVKSASKTPGAPIFNGSGGPGGPGLQAFSKKVVETYGVDIAKFNESTLASRDLVFFTQRGTEGAKPRLDCPAYETVSLEAATKGWSEQEKEAQIAKTLEACRDKFVAEGVDFSAYNSDESAADVNDIRQAMGYDKVIYYGISYGTLLGQFLMRNHPEALEAVVLDGLVPATFTAYSQINNVPNSFKRLFDACKADEACNKYYPDLEGTLAKVSADLDANPQPVIVPQADGTTATVKINGIAVMNGLFNRMIGGDPTLPATIYQLAKNDPETLASLATFVPSVDHDGAFMMHLAVNCSDDPHASLDEFKIGEFAPLYRGMINDDSVRELAGCKLLNVPRLSDASDAPVTSTVPVLLFNGSLDAATAPEYGKMVADYLPNSQNIVIPGGAHGNNQNPCAMAILTAFAANPSAKVDTSCLPSKPVFKTPFVAKAASADGAAVISITLSEKFTPAQDGFWQTGPMLVGLKAFPAGTTATDVLKQVLDAAKTPFDPAQMKEGSVIAGVPSQVVQGKVNDSLAYALIAFNTKSGGYMISVQAPPAAIDVILQQMMPEIFNTVAVTN